MPIESEPYSIQERGWTVRLAAPGEDPAPAGATRPLLLLHGRTGDENVMWIFTRGLPRDRWIFAPRAPLASEEGGYTWLPPGAGWPKLADFQTVAAALLAEIQHWTARQGLPAGPLDVMGFSQGAAMAYALAAFYPQQVQRVIALAGFLPGEDPLPGRYAAFQGKKVYVAHGSKDETVPVNLAQEAVRALQAAGAEVIYCESEVGHKLSAPCLRGLTQFLSQ